MNSMFSNLEHPTNLFPIFDHRFYEVFSSYLLLLVDPVEKKQRRKSAKIENSSQVSAHLLHAYDLYYVLTGLLPIIVSLLLTGSRASY